jgi:DNA-binding transcriptional LysR family regulator
MRSLISQISIHKLEVFCLVAELGSVSRAAERLGIAQPVVSAHLKALAQKLGTLLTVRQGGQVRLTESGQRVHRWAQEVVSRTRELEREMAESKRGIVGKASVGASMTIGSYVLPALIVGFHNSYPKGEVSVRVTTPLLVTDAVRAGDCDFAFTILDPRHDTVGLEVEPVKNEQLVLVASQRMPVGSRLQSLAELAELPFVSAQSGTPRRELEDYLLSRFGVRRARVEIEFGHAEALKQAVRAGAGAAFLFRASVRDELASGVLREIAAEGMQLEAPVYQVRRRGKKLSTYQLSLMRYLAEAMCDEAPGEVEATRPAPAVAPP